MKKQNNLETHIKEKKLLCKRLDLCDTNIWLGTPKNFPLASSISHYKLDDELNKYGIQKGCLSHWSSYTTSAQIGNKLLAEISSTLNDNFKIIYTALPLFPERLTHLPTPKTNLPKLGGVRVFPRTHCFAQTLWMLDSLCDWLNTEKIPLFVWHTEINIENLFNIASAFPGLQIILESQPQKLIYHTYSVFALMKKCKNIHLEISNLVAPGVFKYAVEQFGPDRFVYGSFLPVNDPFVSISLLLESGVSKKDINLIAGGNIQRIMEKIKC